MINHNFAKLLPSLANTVQKLQLKFNIQARCILLRHDIILSGASDKRDLLYTLHVMNFKRYT